MKDEVDKISVGKGAAYLYFEAVTMMFSGFLYWLILSKVTEPSVIGSASVVFSIATIFTAIAAVGVSSGIQRFLARCIVDKDTELIKRFINSALLITAVGITISTVLILSFKDWLYYSFKLEPDFILISIIIMITMVFTLLLRSIIVTTLQTQSITISSILSTIVKFSITISLIFIGIDIMGILAGISLYYITTIIILTNKIKNIFYKQNSNMIDKTFKLNEFFNITKKLLTASIVFWIPFVIGTFGTQLGTVFVFSSNGASQAGIYFISFSIFTGISLIVSVLSTIAYPTISSLVDGRKRAVWQLMKISLTIILPISIPIIVYSSELLQILGSSYASGSSILSILLLANIPNSINMGVGILVYAYGNNRMVLILGLFTSIPRTLLYFVLVPVLGGNGAALVYLIGSIVGCMASIIIAKKTGLKLFWRQIMVIPIIPLIFVFFFKYFEINYILGLLGTISISYVLFLRLGILDSDTLKDILKILPEKIRNPIQYMVNKISNK